MAKHAWSILCGGTSIDKETNAISLFNVIATLTITVEEEERERFKQELKKTGRHPIFPVEMYLVTTWERSDLEKPEMVEIRIANYAPSGQRGKITVPGTVDLQDYQSYRIRAEIGGFVYRGDGRYWLVVEYKERGKWKTAARLPVRVYLRIASKKDAEGAAP